ncbi:MAG TPA: ABC transporter substrate-binding protein [Burkholderiales bacterium]
MFALATGVILCAAGQAGAAQPVEISFYYPVAVGGPLTRVVDEFTAQFEREHPAIRVKAVYTGTYKESVAKAITAHKSGVPPAAAVLLSTDMHSLIDNDAIVPFDQLATSAEDAAWLRSFHPSLMTNSLAGGRTWGIPFQRSTILLYWNKAAFREAGLDPERAPRNRAEMLTYAQKLTRVDAQGRAEQWGVQIPSSLFSYWMFQGLTIGSGIALTNPAGTATRFDDPGAVEALQFWVDLSRKYKVHPPGIVEWGTTPQDFLAGKTAMAWMSSGNLAAVRDQAKFAFGVAMLPGGTRRGSPTGGGNFYIFRGAPAQEQRAAFEFIRWVTAPERAARWSIATGYIAVREDAWRTPAMNQYLAEFPAGAVAREQLASSAAELSTHRNQRVTQALNRALRDALTGVKAPQQALRDAQAEATAILRPFQR